MLSSCEGRISLRACNTLIAGRERDSPLGTQTISGVPRTSWFLIKRRSLLVATTLKGGLVGEAMSFVYGTLRSRCLTGLSLSTHLLIWYCTKHLNIDTIYVC